MTYRIEIREAKNTCNTIIVSTYWNIDLSPSPGPSHCFLSSISVHPYIFSLFCVWWLYFVQKYNSV